MAYGKYIMVVTNDEFELPMSPPMRQKDLARFLGINASTICHYFKYSGRERRGKKKFIKLDFDVDEVES